MDDGTNFIEDAIKISRSAIENLNSNYLSRPSIYLEEKHLHNEFDKIIKEMTVDFNFPLITKTFDGHEFPIFINEYVTINKYKRSDSYESINQYRSNPAKLDYVILDPNWINKNKYIACVNKHEPERGTIRKNNEIPFLVSIEFKFLHFGRKYKSFDNSKNSLSFLEETKTSRKDRIKKEMIADATKQVKEGIPMPNVVYFNSEIPLPITDIKTILLDVKSTFKNSQLALWYSQGGITQRFKDQNDFYSINI
ncbi:hypothetical protein CLV96_3925 [Leptospira meyeri]|uniref:Restriction endonuclease n=1 Tax=Leptospira meyeri TaxID=29508 RepID=A0A4R8MK05_LEPME|nr:hypothetical protein [Leptospira meyeri]EKJ86156.1 hypothetical protein LEP1GSC017_0009 [Leptospira meyeri serovar Hardjo str. Went 5]TDY66546.1 hypothetical protein CLV96_3925 [Leptospira meyeri]